MRAASLIALIVFTVVPAAAGYSKVDSKTDARIGGFAVDMAQHFTIENFHRPARTHFAVTLGASTIHARSADGRWVVIGSFMAKTGPDGYHPHNFVAMVILTCTGFEKMACWQLQKLAIDNQMISLGAPPSPPGPAADK